jgi:hypothetical protein
MELIWSLVHVWIIYRLPDTMQFQLYREPIWRTEASVHCTFPGAVLRQLPIRCRDSRLRFGHPGNCHGRDRRVHRAKTGPEECVDNSSIWMELCSLMRVNIRVLSSIPAPPGNSGGRVP